MKYKLMELLCCPQCENDLELNKSKESRGEIESGWLFCSTCQIQYPIVAFIPRFVNSENYANNFGFQWNRFQKTQLDSYSGIPISRERFFRSTNWSPDDLKGKNILDVGCGSGRFAEVTLSCGANVIALDYSSSVDACWKNLGTHSRLNVVQADIYHLPFKPNSFDFIYCLGVLQHTPNVQKAFMSLPVKLKNQGRLAVDVYPRLPLNLLWSKYWLRPLTKRMPQQALLQLVELMVKHLLPLSITIGYIPIIGQKIKYALPIVNYNGVYDLSEFQLKEWAILDTFDMLSPQYDQPQSIQSLFKWFTEANMKQIEIFRSGFLIGRGVKSFDQKSSKEN